MIWVLFVAVLVLALTQSLTLHGHCELMNRVRNLEEEMPLPDKWQAPDIDTPEQNEVA